MVESTGNHANNEVTKRIADYLTSTELEDFPPDAIEAAKGAIVDCFGCALAGSTEPRYGLDHFGFEVDDMGEVAAHLKSNGVKFNCEPWTMPSGSMVAFIEAPDKVSVEIIQRPKA